MKTLKFILSGAFIMLFGAAMAQDLTTKYTEAAALYTQQKFAEAIPAFEEVMKLSASATDDEMELVAQAKKLLPDLYFRVGGMSAQQGNFDDALVYMTKAYELSELYGNEAMMLRVTPMLSRVYQALGASAFNSKDYPKAIEVFSQAYKKFPTEADPALLLAKSYAESGDLAKATEVYNSVIALESRHSRYATPAATAKKELAGYMLVEASAAAADKDLARVIEATDAVLSSDPANAAAHLLRVQTATNLKDFDKVIEFANAAAEAQTDADKKSDVYFYLASAYENKGNKPLAIENYRKVTTGTNAADAKKQATALAQ